MKKKVYTLLLLFCFLGSVAWSQTRTPGQARAVRPYLPQMTNEISVRAALDTTLQPKAFEDTCALRATGFTIDGAWGFVAGMNEFEDLEKAQRLEIPSDLGDKGLVQAAIVFFDVASIVGDGEWTIKIYNIFPADGGPGEVLGTSAPLKVSDIQIDEQSVVPTIVLFDEPVAVGDEFFVSVDFSKLYESQDTVGILQTDIDCGDGSDSWELFSDGESWLPINDEDFSWGIDANFYIFALVTVDDVSSIAGPVAARRGLTLHPAFPNPAGESVQLNFDLERGSPVTVELFGMDGRLLRRLDQGDLPGGSHTLSVDIRDLPAGAYIYGVATEQTRLMSRLVVR